MTINEKQSTVPWNDGSFPPLEKQISGGVFFRGGFYANERSISDWNLFPVSCTPPDLLDKIPHFFLAINNKK